MMNSNKLSLFIQKKILPCFLLAFSLSGTGQTFEFIENLEVTFPKVSFSAIAFSDVDNDGDQDVLITGKDEDNEEIAKLFKNNGIGEFTEDTEAGFNPCYGSGIAFGDIDGDGDEDVIISSISNYVYENDGTGHFTVRATLPYDHYYGAVEFADIDADGDLDFVITGGYNTNLYFNDGLGNFSEDETAPFVGHFAGDIAFADFDGDTDLDLIITGRALWDSIAPTNPGIAHLYKNDGAGNYTKYAGIDVFAGVKFSSVAFNDIDHDGDVDLLITGQDNFSTPQATLYKNDGTGIFMEIGVTPLIGAYRSSVNFVDLDLDGNSEVLITGNDGTENTAKLYTSNDMGIFTEVLDMPFEGVYLGTSTFSDVDGDGDQDLIISGVDNEANRITKLYLNTLFTLSTDNDVLPARDVSAYPNPAQSETTISTVGVFDYQLLNSQGEIIQTGKGIDQVTLSLVGLSKGTYFVRVVNAVETSVVRVSKM